MRLALIILAAMVSSCSEDDGEKSITSSADLACVVATNYADTLLLKQNGQRAVFADTPEDLPDQIGGGEWNGPEGGKGVSPPPSLLADLKATAGVSAVKACASLRSHLDSKGVGYGTKAVEEATQLQKNGNFRATVLGISLPAVSKDGREAVLASSGVAAPEAGSGFIQYLRRRPDGAWIVIGWSGLWIS